MFFDKIARRVALVASVVLLTAGMQSNPVAAQQFERVAGKSLERVEKFDTCRYVDNKNADDIFVALNSQQEWNTGTTSFLTKEPPNVNVQPCGLQFKKVVGVGERFCGIDLAGATWCWGERQDSSGYYTRATKMGFVAAKDINATASRVCIVSTTGNVFCQSGTNPIYNTGITAMASIKGSNYWLCGETTTNNLRCFVPSGFGNGVYDNNNFLYNATNISDYILFSKKEGTFSTGPSAFSGGDIADTVCFIDNGIPRCMMLELVGLVRVGKNTSTNKPADFPGIDDAKPQKLRFWTSDGFGGGNTRAYDFNRTDTVRFAQGVPGNLKKFINVSRTGVEYIKADGTVGRTAWSNIIDADGNISDDSVPTPADIAKGVFNYQDTTPGVASNLRSATGSGSYSGPAVDVDVTSGNQDIGSGYCILKTSRDVVCLKDDIGGSAPEARNYTFDVDLKSIAATSSAVCGTDLDNGLWCMGSNTKGQLGQGNTNASSASFLIR